MKDKKFTLSDFIQGVSGVSKSESDLIWDKIDSGSKAYREDISKMNDDKLYAHVYDGNYDFNCFATIELLSRGLDKFHIGDIVSEIENHVKEIGRKDCIHRIIFIRPFPHGKYFEIGLSGYSDEDIETETFSEFQVYKLPDLKVRDIFNLSEYPNL